MQANVITLSVNEDNDDGTTAEVEHSYQRYEEYLNRSIYIGENHVPAARDIIGMYRTFPKVNGNFKGVEKSSLKATKDIVVNGVDGLAQLTSPLIGEVNFSIPVGATDSDVLLLRMKLVAAIMNDGIMIPLVKQLVV